MRLDVLAKVLNLCVHPGTGPEEVRASLERVRTLMNGKDFSEILAEPKGETPEETVSFSKMMGFEDLRELAAKQEAELKALKKEATKKDETIARQNDVIVELEQKTSARIKPDANDNIPYGLFAAEVMRRLGKVKGWQHHFANQTGYKVHQISSWGFNGVAPFEAYKKATTLQQTKKSEMAQPVKWTVELVEIVRENHGKISEDAISKLVAAKIGHMVTPGQIKRLKINSREHVAPFNDPAFGGPIGVSRN